MGNSAGKESRGPGRSRPGSRAASSSGPSAQTGEAQPQTQTDRFISGIYGSRGARGSRPDLSFLHLGSGASSDREAQVPERPRETKQEKEARKLEKERIAREKERERSLKEEGIDGGFLVTLGVYTGPEDFSKPTVRQLQIERRLAPFWKGLDDHNDSWAEHQLVAAARGLPIPAADEILPGMERTASEMSHQQRPTEDRVSNLMVPITGRSWSNQSDNSANLSSSHPAFSTLGPSSPTSPGAGSLPLFRGRAKTLASLTTSSRSNSSTNLVPQEMNLPKDPCVNGQPLEAYLYKDAAECPICFLYYPPYLNKTRCCDQPICSECFVQIKRPDPHPPEHHDDPSNPAPEPKPEEEINLVSEPSQCPFCVTREFGVTYEPPPFRRGLTYAGNVAPIATVTSAMSSQTSLGSMGSRRRTTSLSATDKSVITTDKIRPDWIKKLADAKAHALRRSVAATALHNAAYMLGNAQGMDGRGLGLGRRRRTLLGDSPGGSGSGTPINLSSLLGQANREGVQGGDLASGRISSRRTRVDDLEDLMMMEAIRLSLAAEEERARKEEKDRQKEEKKKAKEDAKATKKAEKAAKKAGKAGSLYPASTNESTSTWASTSMARSTSNLGENLNSPTMPLQGKGKAPATGMTSIGFSPLDEPTSTLNTEMTGSKEVSNKGLDDPQRHLEESRANLNQPSQPIALRPNPGHQRQFSSASSIASSMLDSNAGSYRNESGFVTPPDGIDATPGAEESKQPGNSLEPMFNFRSLAAMIGDEDRKGQKADHVEHLETAPGAEQSNEHQQPMSDMTKGPTHTTTEEQSEGSNLRSNGHLDIPTQNGNPRIGIMAPTPQPSNADHKQLGHVEMSPSAERITQS